MARRVPGGFTLTELVVVIIIATVLAAFALARIDTRAFDTEGFSNQAIAMTRYAQRLAISQRRTVAVVVTAGNPGTLKLCYTNTSCAGGNVTDPSGGALFQYQSKAGVTVGGTVGSGFTFDALGKPYDSSGTAFASSRTITVAGDVTRTITIEAETGYVH